MVRNSLGSRFTLILLVLAFLAGCNAPQSHLAKFNDSFKTESLSPNTFDKTIQFAQSKISKAKNPKGEDLLWSMQLGCVERLRQDYRQSNIYFDKSEEMLNFFDHQNKALDSAAAVAVSDNVVPYLGEEYDGIMINTYKALNFMHLGKNDLARVEFNRALDRQRRAKEKFAGEIAKVKNELEQEQSKENSRVKQNVENPEVQELISNKYPGLHEFEAYPDFINPFTTYIAGVYFNLVGDHSKAVTFLKESSGMVSDNKYMAEDLAVTEQILDGRGELKDTAWVIFENGMGPIKKEFRIDIPLFLRDNKVKYVGIALPQLTFRKRACSSLSIRAAGQTYNTQIVADMDRIVQTEFNKDFKGILTRAIIAATAKAAAQYALAKEGNSEAGLASVLVAVYTFATTAADVRIWTTLPKDFQVARFPIPADRLITVEIPGSGPLKLEIPPCKNAIVYIRMPFAETKAVLDIIKY